MKELTTIEIEFIEELKENKKQKGRLSFLNLIFSSELPDKNMAIKGLNNIYNGKYSSLFEQSVILFESEDSIYVGKYKDVFWGTWSEGELYFCAKEIQNICSSIRNCLIGPVDEPDYKEEVIDYFQEQFNIDYDKYIEEYKDFCLEIGLIYGQ